MATIDKLEFKGLIGNLPWRTITMNQFINALKQNGWREAHNGHIYKRLKERGPRLAIRTPNEFARALRHGKTEKAQNGAQKRVCGSVSGTWYLIYRGTAMITFRDAAED